jgi:hypothetical protein
VASDADQRHAKYLGYVDAPDEETARKQAAKEFNVGEALRDRIVARKEKLPGWRSIGIARVTNEFQSIHRSWYCTPVVALHWTNSTQTARAMRGQQHCYRRPFPCPAPFPGPIPDPAPFPGPAPEAWLSLELLAEAPCP